MSKPVHSQALRPWEVDVGPSQCSSPSPCRVLSLACILSSLQPHTLFIIAVSNFFLAEMPILLSITETCDSTIMFVKYRHIVGIQQMIIPFLLSPLKRL